MHVSPPTAAELEQGIARITRRVDSRIAGRRLLHRVGIGLALVAALGAGGAGVATAVAPPSLLHLDGLVKAQYAAPLAQCIRDAGWNTAILDSKAAASILAGSGLDPATTRVLRTLVSEQAEPAAGRAITACQQRLQTVSGDSIMATG
ncbi:hypothetical protein [uncultured Amnibacterium sp.]|uniref:hypothetical protein n=1 Tax=uncultured Amnibacterium sp. TaxID=1631851 RepID=UPI0035CC7AED